jgi:hypothetical protein
LVQPPCFQQLPRVTYRLNAKTVDAELEYNPPSPL